MWHNMTEGEDNVRFYLTVFGGLAAANCVFTLFRAFLFAYGGVCAAVALHDQLFRKVLLVSCFKDINTLIT